MHCVNLSKGFAVLTSALLLSIAGIAFTVNMAATQLVDNKIVGNYYRNNEAFANAESGINFVFSQLTDVGLSTALLSVLPYQYSSQDHHYTVQVNEINGNTLEIISYGRSMDDSAQRTIQLQANYRVDFNPPSAPISIDGKLNLDATATVNDGCEGLTAGDCLSEGNISDYMIVSAPDGSVTPDEDNSSDVLCFSDDPLDENNIDPDAFYGDASSDRLVDNNGDWGDVRAPEGSRFFGLDSNKALAPSSLFEATFGINKVDALAKMTEAGNSGVLEIDMTVSNAQSCSEQLKNISVQQSVIYIKGNCNIDQNDAAHSDTSENKRFTIGTVEYPKMVIIEGGTFTTQPNTGASVIGLLYFIPDKKEVIDANGDVVGSEESLSVDMGGIRVNGALLSDYKCSHDGYDKSDPNGSKQHFSVRYDKTVLNDTYQDAGAAAFSSSYNIVAGTWRDF